MTARTPIILLATLLAACASTPTVPTAPTAPAEADAEIGFCALRELREYSAYSYPRAVEQTVELARRLLAESLAEGLEKAPAIVFDIDETSLTNWQYLESGICQPVSKFNEFAALGVSPPLEPVLELYRWARERDITFFFVTGRREDQREPTERNLREAGYTEWGEIFMRPVEDSGSWSNFKADSRRKVTESGYEVLLNMGDQPDDLAGGYARHAVLMPNPFYVVAPRDYDAE